jgi:Sulfatase
VSIRLVVALVAAFFALGATAHAQPNIVLVLTDDQRWDELEHMPNVQALQAQGVTFTNSFVSNSLCCPSRASILTGHYAHTTGVWTNSPGAGGWSAFHRSGFEDQTIARTLQDAGFRTGLVGKYFNGYNDPSFIPAGWSDWNALLLGGWAGGGHGYYDYWMTENGDVDRYDAAPEDYSASVNTAQAVDFIRSTKHTQPLFLYLAYMGPHSPATPPPGSTACANYQQVEGPNFGDIGPDEPLWIRLRTWGAGGDQTDAAAERGPLQDAGGDRRRHRPDREGARPADA